MKYAVIFTYSFDDKTEVYLFEDYGKAQSYLRKCYDHEMRVIRDVHKASTQGEINEDCSYAKVTTYIAGSEDAMEIRIGTIYG